MSKATDIIDKLLDNPDYWDGGDFGTTFTHKGVLEAMKEIASLAFDAGVDIASKYETNFPANALTKEQYITKLFDNE